MMLRLMASVLLVLMVTNAAAAQPGADDVHNQSIGGGAQWALPSAGRGDAPGVQVSWRRWFSPYLGIGTDFRVRRASTVTEIDFPAQTAPGGIAVGSQQGRDARRISSYCLGAGLLARGSLGRLSLIGGAGPGFFVDRRAHDTRINDSRSSGSEAMSSIGLFMLAEVEVRATSRLSVFAGLRGELRDVRVSESSSGYPTAGIRFAF